MTKKTDIQIEVNEEMNTSMFQFLYFLQEASLTNKAKYLSCIREFVDLNATQELVPDRRGGESVWVNKPKSGHFKDIPSELCESYKGNSKEEGLSFKVNKKLLEAVYQLYLELFEHAVEVFYAGKQKRKHGQKHFSYDCLLRRREVPMFLSILLGKANDHISFEQCEEVFPNDFRYVQNLELFRRSLEVQGILGLIAKEYRKEYKTVDFSKKISMMRMIEMIETAEAYWEKEEECRVAHEKEKVGEPYAELIPSYVLKETWEILDVTLAQMYGARLSLLESLDGASPAKRFSLMQEEFSNRGALVDYDYYLCLLAEVSPDDLGIERLVSEALIEELVRPV